MDGNYGQSPYNNNGQPSQQPVYQQPIYSQPIYQQPAVKKGLRPGAIVAIVLGSVAFLTVCVIVFVVLFRVPSYTYDNNNGYNNGNNNEYSHENPEPVQTTPGQYYYTSASIPDDDIFEHARLIAQYMMLPDNGNENNWQSDFLWYDATPDMIYSNLDLQTGVLWCSFYLSDLAKDVSIDNINGKYVYPAEMELRAKRMFGVDILQFSIPSGSYVPYYNSEYGVYVEPQAGMLDGYFADELEIVGIETDTVWVNVHVYERFYDANKRDEVEIDRGWIQVRFDIKEDSGEYYLHFNDTASPERR